MKIFKLMFLKKKKKLDNKGAALANVLLITTFVMVLTSSVLSMAYNSYRMKLINVNSKDNFYTCEAVLEQVRVAFRNEFSVMTEDLTEITTDDLSEVFENFYKEYRLEGYTVGTTYSINKDNSESNYYYDVGEVAKLLTSITGTDGAELFIGKTNASLSYDNSSSPVFISSVEIAVDGYDNIKVTLQANATGTNNFELTSTSVTFHDLTVIYQEDSYESQVTTDITIEFPETGTLTVSTSSGDKGGLKTLLENRVKSYEEWSELIPSKYSGLTTDPDFEDFDFDITSVPNTAEEVVYLNTTDYPANTVSYVIFDMTRYLKYTGSNGWFDGYGQLNTYYQYLPVYPWVQVQNGSGTGGQYIACGNGDYGNVEIYVGPDDPTDAQLEDDTNWVPYTEVFDENNNLYVLTDGNSSVTKYIAKYGDQLSALNGSLTVDMDIPTVKYRVHLIDDSGNLNSRGWIEVTGGVMGDAKSTAYEAEKDVIITPSMEDVKIYVELDDNYYTPDYCFTDFNLSAQGDGTTGTETSGYIFLDMSESEYAVGDVLHITLTNISSANYNMTGNDAYYFSINQQTSYMQNGTYGLFYPAMGTYIEDVAEVKFSSTTAGDGSVTYTEEIWLTMKWDTYPYIRIQYAGATGTVGISMVWESDSGSTISSTTGSYADDASIYYRDWRKE